MSVGSNVEKRRQDIEQQQPLSSLVVRHIVALAYTFVLIRDVKVKHSMEGTCHHHGTTTRTTAAAAAAAGPQKYGAVLASSSLLDGIPGHHSAGCSCYNYVDYYVLAWVAQLLLGMNLQYVISADILEWVNSAV